MYVKTQLLRQTITFTAVIATCSFIPAVGTADPGFSFGGNATKNASSAESVVRG